MTMTIAEAAQRSIDDPTFAQSVLDGTENFPEVRAAILADLRALDEESEVEGFLNPQPLPPGDVAALTFQKIELGSISWGATLLPSVQILANPS